MISSEDLLTLQTFCMGIEDVRVARISILIKYQCQGLTDLLSNVLFIVLHMNKYFTTDIVADMFLI